MMLQNQEESQIHDCAECKRSFSSGKALGGHMSSAHVQASKDLYIKNMEKEHTKNYKLVCDQCQKEFSSRKALFGHMRSHPDREQRGMEPPPLAGGIKVGTPEIDSESNQRTKSGNVRGKRGRPAAVCTNPDNGSSINSESTDEIMVDDLEKLRKMVENFKRHKSQGPDFSDHHKETYETEEKALEFSSKTESMKVKETKGDDQSRGNTQKKSKKSKEKSLMIKEDSAIKMVANFERQKYQGPDFSDHMKETNEPDEKSPEFSSELTNEPGEKSLEFLSGPNEVPDSRISTEKAIESKGVDQCRARAQKRSRKSKEKSLIIKEEDSSIKVPLKEGKTKFTCRKCGMSYTNHQALGGHMASHEKMIIRVWNEIEHVHDNKQASETKKKKKKKRVKNTASVTGKVESGENTTTPVEEINKIVDTQPVVEGCNSSANVTENTEIARRVLDFDLNEMPNEED